MSISIIVIALLFVLLVVFCVLSAKSWHWANIVFLILTYIAGVAASVGLAQVLDGRRKALQAVEDSELRLFGVEMDSDSDGIDDYIDPDFTRGRDNDGDGVDDSRQGYALENQGDYVIYGPPGAVSYGVNSLRGLTEELKMQTRGRGRIWSGQVAANGNNRTFTFAQARDFGDDNPSSLQNVVLFAFINTELDGVSYPTTFVGTVRVVNETAQALELEPDFLVTQDLYDSVGMWSLYEKMPADRHDTYTAMKELSVQDDGFDITAFRNELETQYLPANLIGFDINNADPEIARTATIAYERFIDRICFDGMSIGRIEQWIANAPNRASGDFSPPPEEIFVKYKFTKKSSVDRPYIVDAEGNIETEGTFTRTGQAIDKGLHAGSEVRFEVDDTVLVDLLNVNGYQRDGGGRVQRFDQRESVVEVDRIFVRKLKDFPHVLQSLRVQATELREKSEVVKSEIVIGQATLADAQSQESKRDVIIEKLREDEKNLTQDLNNIGTLLKDREREAQELREKIKNLDEEIQRRRGEIQ